MRLGSIATLAALATGCSWNTAPAGFLPTPQEAGQDAYGGWAEFHIPGREDAIEGELIAVSADTLWVLTRDSGVVIPTRSVREGKVTAYAKSSASGWVALGVVSTISNGVFLVLTAPTWLLTGAIAAQSDANAAQRATPLKWSDLSKFARFPQGLPEGVTLANLKVKEVVSER